MAGPGLVWVTRAEPGASHTGSQVRALGRTPITAPLLEVRPVQVVVDLSGVSALAFSSANAVRAFAALTADRSLPAYAVGGKTAAALEASGFTVAGYGEGGVEELAGLLVKEGFEPTGLILHPSAREPAGDLVAALSGGGVNVQRLVVYETATAEVLPSAAKDALTSGELDAVLIHSPKAGRTLAELIGRTALQDGFDRVRALGLSTACLGPLADLACAARLAPAHPREADLLALL